MSSRVRRCVCVPRADSHSICVEVILSLGLVFLNVLESYIGYVTVVVFRKKKKKLAALKEQIQMREYEVSERTMA